MTLVHAILKKFEGVGVKLIFQLLVYSVYELNNLGGKF